MIAPEYLLVQLLLMFQTLGHLSCKVNCNPTVSLCLPCCSMTTTGELVDKGDIPEERKDHVKKVLDDMGCAASRAVSKAFQKITKKDMTDAGTCIADANAILAEVEPPQGDLL